MEKQDPTPERGLAAAVDTPFSLFEEISSFLLWTSTRWPALGLYGLVLATMLWMDFIHFFDLPVSFVSPGMLTALPVLGLAVGAPVAAMMVGVACAAAALWVPLVDDGPSLMSWAGEVAAEQRTDHPDVFNRWMVLSVLQSVYWPAWFALRYVTHAIPADIVWPVGALISLIVGFALFWPVFQAAVPGRRPRLKYLGIFAFNVAFQTGTATLLVLPVLASTDASRIMAIALHGEAYLFILIGMGLSQLVAAKLFTRGWRHDLLKKAFLVVMVVLGGVLALPGAGGTLAAYRLRMEGPDHSSCLRFRFEPSSTSVPADVRDAKAPGQTMRLDFVTRLDDTYFVKARAQEGPTYVLPASAVSGILACTSGAATPPAPALPIH